MALWGLDILGDFAATWIGFGLFLIDYLAQMYDPHPDNPGPWFKRHFHRFINDDTEEYKALSSHTKLVLFFILTSMVAIGLLAIEIGLLTQAL